MKKKKTAQEIRIEENNLNEKARIDILAERIKLLFGFCAELIKDKDLVKKVLEVSEKRRDFALSGAPILGAFGIDYEEREVDAKLHAERAKALLNLLETLERTETERAEFSNKQIEIAKNRKQIESILGM